MNNSEVRCVVRHSGEKFQKSWDGLVDSLKELLVTVHQQMYNKALEARDNHLKTVSNWDEFLRSLNKREICLADWCDEVSCEGRIKDLSKEESMKQMAEMNEDEALLTGSAKTLCIPYTMGR